MNIWEKLFNAALNVQEHKVISPFIEAGGVSAALLTKAGNIYTGVCIDTACGLGMCAERNAIANMLTHGESEIEKLLCIMSNGKLGSPCGACRETLMQLSPNSGKIEILTDYEKAESIHLEALMTQWWGKERFESFTPNPITFNLLNKADCSEKLNELFDILHGNMNVIAPTGESYEADKAMWLSGIREALNNPQREIVIVNNKTEIIGFFMYCTSGNLLKMEEIQLKPQHHGKGIFNPLFNFVFRLIPEEVIQVEAYANKANIKSQGILGHLALHRVGENKNGNSWRYCGSYPEMKRVIKAK